MDASLVAATALVVVAYLLGSLSFAVIVSRCYGLPDPRSFGSGNPGATNVLRTGRRAAAALTLAGDAGKGVVAVLLARGFMPEGGEALLALVALAAFAGHLWPLFFRFQGGKGVATAGGILLAINLWLGAGVLATWLILVLVSRISSLGALAAAVFAPLWSFWLFGLGWTTGAVLVIACLLLYRHKDNLRRLLAGEEGRFGRGRAGAGPDRS